MGLRLAATNGVVLEHTPHVCTGKGNHVMPCMWCDGGLFSCTVCDSFEGATTTHCVGRKMTEGEISLVYAGKLDFKFGAWVNEASGSCSSHFTVIENITFLNGKRFPESQT